jgi:hypothetical protein
LHDGALSERESLEAVWARNIAYYFGFQHLIYDSRLRTIEVDSYRDEYVINRIAPFVEQRVAKLTRSKPILGVVPDKTDPLVIKGADISEKLLKHLWKVNNKDDKLYQAALLMVLAGSSFKKVCWDAEGGEPLLDDADEDGNIVLEEGTGQRKMTKVWLGDIDNIVRSSFEIIHAPGAKCIKDAEWIMERTQRNALEVLEKFPKFDIDKATKSGEELTRFEKFVSNLGCPAMGSYGYGIDRSDYGMEVKESQIVMVKEFWMKPNMYYPEGILATVVGDQLLQFEEWEYEHEEYPYIKLDCYKNPVGFYGISPVTRLIEVQRHYNEARTQISKNGRYMANLKWWAPKGCGLADDALTDEEGEVVETNPNMPKPEAMQVAPLPNYVIENQNQDLIDFRDVGGERSVDQQPFANLTAGVALETAAELADIGLGPTLKNIEQALMQEGRLELLLANQYYTDERIIKIAGEKAGAITVVTFKNTDLQHQTDVNIQLESALGQTRAAVRQSLMDMWDRRIITDPQQFKKAFATGNMDVILKDKDPAEAIVLEDIAAIKEGKMPTVQPFDNHITFISMLSEFIQTPEFRKLAPDRQQIAMQVLQQHTMAVMPQQPMMEQNPAASGTPFGPQVTGPEIPGMPGPEAMMPQGPEAPMPPQGA